VVAPYRAAHQRALGPSPVPSVIATGLPGFTVRRSVIVNGFRLVLLGARTPSAIVPAKLPGTGTFAPAP
jgi:hypothetical protein